MQPGAAISEAIGRATARGSPALVAFLTAGFPDREPLRGISWPSRLPPTSSRSACRSPIPWRMDHDPACQPCRSRGGRDIGVDTRGPCRAAGNRAAPLLLMSYLNPLLAFGLGRLAARGKQGRRLRVHRAGPAVRGERRATRRTRPRRHRTGAARDAGDAAGPAGESCGDIARIYLRGDEHRHDGRDAAIAEATLDYLTRVRSASAVPVCAGFGIRSASQVTRLAGHADGVIVGSALVEAIERGEDAEAGINRLRC